MDVDEARRDGLAGAIDGARGGDAGEVADGADAVAGDRDVGAMRRAAAAVDDVAAAELEVAIHGHVEVVLYFQLAFNSTVTFEPPRDGS